MADVPVQLSQQGGTLIPAATSFFQNAIKNPSIILSTFEGLGKEYEDEKRKGLSDPQALNATLYSWLINTVIELGGDKGKIQEWAEKSGDGLLKRLVSAINDGGKESLMKSINRFSRAAVSNEPIPWFSRENEEAVVNPKENGLDFLKGAAKSLMTGKIRTPKEWTVPNQQGVQDGLYAYGQMLDDAEKYAKIKQRLQTDTSHLDEQLQAQLDAAIQEYLGDCFLNGFNQDE